MQAREIAERMLPRVFEDQHFLFVHKPAGISINSPIKGRPGGVIEAIALLCDGPAGNDLRACYRLEKYTSGLLGLAKTAAAADRFQQSINSRGVRFQFLAVVRGQLKSATTTRPAATPKRTPAARTPPSRRRPPTASGEPHVETIRSFERYSLVRAVSRKGGSGTRIRAALRGLRIPVLGDARFDPRPNRSQAGRFFLHLQQIDFKHPFTGKPIRLTTEAPDAFDNAARGQNLLNEHLAVALAARMHCLLDPQTDAFRLLNHGVEGIPGLVAQKYAHLVVFQTLHGKFQGGREMLDDAARWYARNLGLRAVYLKNIPRDRSRASAPNDDRLSDPNPIWGRPAEPEVQIQECGINYLIHPYDGYLVGLFLDHRENREHIRALAAGKRILNLFAYTCGFSVAAAVGGAAATASVDVSKRCLEWGKRNFEANSIPLDHHRFYCSDVFDYFTRAGRQGRRFDLIVIDPPTFARTKKPARTFQITEHIVPVIEGALPLLDPGGVIFLSTNHRDLSTLWLRDRLTAAAHGRRFKLLPAPSLPPDFTGATDAAKSLLAQF